jgi:hypothetical protein
VWQSLHEELKGHGFTVLAIALDQPEATRQWIDAASPAYPCLIDRDHHVADLYNLVNVPQAVWIDEAGRIVRPPETAGASDAFRTMDRTNFAMPAAAVAERNRVKAMYLDAVRDWARRGAVSAHALDDTRMVAKLAAPPPAIAEAHAHFRLGLHLLREGAADEAQQQLARAAQLHPDSWAIWRQAAPKDARGLASGPAFWARVDALGSRPYYPPADIGPGA